MLLTLGIKVDASQSPGDLSQPWSSCQPPKLLNVTRHHRSGLHITGAGWLERWFMIRCGTMSLAF